MGLLLVRAVRSCEAQIHTLLIWIHFFSRLYILDYPIMRLSWGRMPIFDPDHCHVQAIWPKDNY